MAAHGVAAVMSCMPLPGPYGRPSMKSPVIYFSHISHEFAAPELRTDGNSAV